jgi:hypothetical protein
MYQWSDKWLLQFHPQKCKAMRLGKSITNKKEYSLGDTTLETSKDEKDIGVIIDDELKFSKHMSEKINKANKVMGIIRRTFIYLNEEMFKCLYKSLVRPIIEYANQVWCPYHRKDIDAIERVQRRATKPISGMSN